MARFGSVHEKSRGASAGQRGGKLVGDMARFAYTGDYNTAFAGQQNVASPGERVINSL